MNRDPVHAGRASRRAAFAQFCPAREDHVRQLLAAFCLFLAACTPEADRRPAESPPVPTPAAPPARAADRPVAPAADESPAAGTPAESALAARQAAAQAYLEAARERALQNQREAKASCEAGVADYEACIAAADEAYEAALRNARVEFDARMSEQSGA